MKAKFDVWGMAALILMTWFICGCTVQKNVSLQSDAADSVQYRVAFERKTMVDLGGADKTSSQEQKMAENIEFTMDCQPLAKTSDSGQSFKITFGSMQVRTMDFVQLTRFSDSCTGLSGKSFEILVSRDGRVSSPQLEQELKALSVNSFGPVKHPGARLKTPDFLADIWTMQAILFESLAASRNMTDKVSFHTSHQQAFPIADIAGPIISTTWKREKDSAGNFILAATNRLSSQPPLNPIPSLYSGSFKVDGLLGYLRNCKYESIDGRTVCQMDEQTRMPKEIVCNTDIQVKAIYILTENDPSASMAVNEVLSIKTQ